MADQDKEDIPGVGDFFEQNHRIFAIIGIFGTVAVFLSRENSVLSGVSQEVGVFVSLIIFIMAGLTLSNEVFKTLLNHVGDRNIVSEVGFVIILLSTLLLIASIGHSLVSQFKLLIQISLPIILLIIGLLIDIHIYPTNYYKFNDSTDSWIPEISGFFSALIYVLLFDALALMVKDHFVEDYLATIASVGLLIILAIVLHLVISEALIGILVCGELIEENLDTLHYFWRLPKSSMVFFILLITYVFSVFLFFKSYFYTGPGNLAFAYQRWDVFLLYHWILITVISGLSLIRYDYGDREDYQTTVEDLTTDNRDNAVLYGLFTLSYIIYILIAIFLIQFEFLHGYGLF